VWSPSGYLVAFKSDEKRWTIENADGSNSHDYTFDISTNSPRTIDYPRDWSPDGRILIFEGQEVDVERGLVSHILINTLSGKMEKIDFNGYQYWQFVANTHNMIFAGRTRLYLYDPVTKSQSTIFSGGDLIEFMPSMNFALRPGVGFSPPSGLYVVFGDNLVYVFISSDKRTELRQFNLQNNSQHTIMVGGRIERIVLNKQFIAIAGQRRDNETQFVLYDALNSSPVFSRNLPGEVNSMQRLGKNSSWIAITTQQDKNSYGWLINTDTRETRSIGIGKFEIASFKVLFRGLQQLIFLSPKSDNMLEYILFDRKANILGCYLLPIQQRQRLLEYYFPKGKTSVISMVITVRSEPNPHITNYKPDGSILWQRKFNYSVQDEAVPLECDGKGIAWDR